MFKILHECCTPQRATKYSACVDLFSNADVTIEAGETKIVPLGVKIDFENLWGNIGFFTKLFYFFSKNRFIESHYLELHPRSSLRAKGLIVGVGVIDLDFDGELGLIVHNPFTNKKTYWKDEWESISTDFKISKGDKIAQIMLKEHKTHLMGYDSEVVRDGGFGSTGK